MLTCHASKPVLWRHPNAHVATEQPVMTRPRVGESGQDEDASRFAIDQHVLDIVAALLTRDFAAGQAS